MEVDLLHPCKKWVVSVLGIIGCVVLVVDFWWASGKVSLRMGIVVD